MPTNPNDIYLPGGLAQAADQARQAGNSTGSEWLPQAPRDRSKIIREWEQGVQNPLRGQNAVQGLSDMPPYVDDTALREAQATLVNTQGTSDQLAGIGRHQGEFDNSNDMSIMDSPMASFKHHIQSINPEKIEGLAMAGSMMPVPAIAGPSMAALGGFGLNRLIKGERGIGGAMDAAGVMFGASELGKLGKIGAEAAQAGQWGEKLASARSMASDPSYSGISRRAIGEMAGLAGSGRSKQSGPALSRLGQSFDAANAGDMAEHGNIWNGRWAEDIPHSGAAAEQNMRTNPQTGETWAGDSPFGGTSHSNYTTSSETAGPIHWGPQGSAPPNPAGPTSTTDNGKMTAEAIRMLKEEAMNKFYKASGGKAGHPPGGGGGGKKPPSGGGKPPSGNSGPTRDSVLGNLTLDEPDKRKVVFGGVSQRNREGNLISPKDRSPLSFSDIMAIENLLKYQP